MARARRSRSAAQYCAADPLYDPRMLTRMFDFNRFEVELVEGESIVVLGPNPSRWYLSFQQAPLVSTDEVWALNADDPIPGLGWSVARGTIVEFRADDYPLIIGQDWRVSADGPADIIVTELVRLPGGITPPAPGLVVIKPII